MNPQTLPVFPDLDIFSPEYACNREKYAARALRDYPLHFYKPLNLWIVSKHKDVRSALFTPQVFSSVAFGLLPPPDDIAPRVPDLYTDVRLPSMDPPEHTKLRVPVQQALLPGRLVGKDEVVRRIANELIDTFIDKGECDLLHDFSYKLALYLIVDLLGIPKERAEDYHRWSNCFFQLFTPKVPERADARFSVPMPEEVLRQNWEGLAEANDYLREVVENLDRNPGNNMLSNLLQLREPDGSRTITISANVRNALDFEAAGHDTTATLIAHLTYFVLTTPGLKDTLTEDPSLIPAAISETLRRRCPVDGLFRRTLSDVELCGQKIESGSIVYLDLTAANLDPDVFPEPETFRLNRDNIKEMVSFGYGRHVCVGQYLSRIEAKAAYEELMRRIPNMRLADGFKLEYMPSVATTVLKGLPLVWDKN